MKDWRRHGSRWNRILYEGNETLRGSKKKTVREHEKTGFRSKSLATQARNDWKELPEEVVDAKSVRDFKRRLYEALTSVFGEGSV